MAQALVPLKDLVQAKTRLAGLLTPSERRALAQAMLEDVLHVLQKHPALQRVTLVSDDPAASLIAQRYGAEHLEETTLMAPGLNPVIEAATDRLCDTVAGPMIVLHADLPLLDAADISAVIQRYESTGGLVIGCDRHRRGTNLLAFGTDSRPRFCFGKDSYALHCRAARDKGVRPHEIFRPGIALDLDEAQDLLELMRRLPKAGERTRALLAANDLGKRLSVALTALETGNSDWPGESAAHE
jgi:2-phospho-L-lactate guanylyltransferase